EGTADAAPYPAVNAIVTASMRSYSVTGHTVAGAGRMRATGSLRLDWYALDASVVDAPAPSRYVIEPTAEAGARGRSISPSKHGNSSSVSAKTVVTRARPVRRSARIRAAAIIAETIVASGCADVAGSRRRCV